MGGINEKIKKRREGFNPNIKGDPNLNVRTEEEGTAEVPASRQKDLSSENSKKSKDKKDSKDPSEESGAKN